MAGRRVWREKYHVNIDGRDTRVIVDSGTSREEIIDRAVTKLFGADCFWFADSGLGWDYGQVFRALPRTKNDSNPGNSSVTDRTRIDIDRIW